TVPEGQVEALEAAAAVDAVGLVEVPAAALKLKWIAVREGIEVTRAVKVELDLDKSIRLPRDEQPPASQQVPGDLQEPLAQGIAAAQLLGLSQDAGPVAHERVTPPGRSPSARAFRCAYPRRPCCPSGS